MRPEEIRPQVIWFTGLSGAGKTTLAEIVAADLKRQGLRVEHLDGDTIRSFFPALGFSREERDQHVRRVALLAKYLEQNGIFVVVSLISPYRDSRAFARQICGNMIEVYLSTPLEVCERRDVKGLYARARRGEITRFTGLDDVYEAPPSAELAIDTSHMEVGAAAGLILDYTKQRMEGETR